ncbi:MAG: matrixin family metalloprotease [Thermoanaerobaculia bacterium]
MKSYRPLVLSFLALSSMLASSAGATTYKMMPDRALADQARVVVEVKVVGVDSAPVVDGPPSTDYLVEVSRVIKGDLSGSTLVVRVPGGINPKGLGLKIWGAPQFTEGESALLFLNPAEDGTYHILHLMLGAFHRRTVEGQTVALRDLSEAHEVGGSGQDVVRDFDRFADWLADRAAGLRHEGSYVLSQAKSMLTGADAKFVLLQYTDGNPIRWFRFDIGQSVAWKVNSSGQPGLGLAATIQAFQEALNAWNSDPNTNINYVYSGTTTADTGLDHSDGTNAIIFNDPNSAVNGVFDCDTGGVIAQGGPFFFGSTRQYKGRAFHEAVEADIETNDGTECLFNNNPSEAQEVFGHELGHTLGLGHSALPDALMYAFSHDDGRGARLTADDRAGINSLYGTGTGGGGGGATLLAPQNLKAHVTSNTEVTLTWRDRAVGETGYRVETKVGKNKYREIKQLDANSSSVVLDDLTPGATYAFRVRAAGPDGKFSPYAVVTLVMPQ